jgi:hypothetical protein
MLEQALEREEKIVLKPEGAPIESLRLQGGELIEAFQYAVPNTLKKYQLMMPQLKRLFEERLGEKAFGVYTTVAELAKNPIDHGSGGELAVNGYLWTKSALVNITSYDQNFNPQAGFKNKEDRGFTDKDNVRWINAGRDGKFGWGKCTILKYADLWVATYDPRTTLRTDTVGFNF